MAAKLLFQIIQPSRQFPVLKNVLPKSYECSDDEYAHLNCPFRIEDTRDHDGPVLRERMRQCPGVFQVTEVVAICDHLLFLVDGQLKDEIIWEPPLVSLHLLVQALCRHTVELGEVRIDDDLLASNEENPLLDRSNSHDGSSSGHNDCPNREAIARVRMQS